MAMLVSTRTSGPLALAGIAKRAHEIVVDRHPGGRDEQPSTALVKRFRGQRFDAQPGALGGHLDLPGLAGQGDRAAASE